MSSKKHFQDRSRYVNCWRLIWGIMIGLMPCFWILAASEALTLGWVPITSFKTVTCYTSQPGLQFQNNPLNSRHYTCVKVRQASSCSARRESLGFSQRKTWSHIKRIPCLLSEPSNHNDKPQYENDLIFNGQSTLGLIGAQSILILASVLAAMILSVPNYGLGAGFRFETSGLLIGTIAVAPLAALAVMLDLVENSVPALKNVTLATQRSVLSLLGTKRKPLTAILVAVSLGLAAGVGEEMLFRGVLQSSLTYRLIGLTTLAQPISIGITSLFFGLLHAVTPLYAVLATLASVYFGWVFIGLGDGNLLIPMVCHAVYDVGALLWAHYVVTGMSEKEQKEILEWVPPGGGGSDRIL